MSKGAWAATARCVREGGHAGMAFRERHSLFEVYRFPSLQAPETSTAEPSKPDRRNDDFLFTPVDEDLAKAGQ